MTARLVVALALAAAVAPAPSAQVLVYGSLARDRDVAPGETYQEVVEVQNTTDEPQQARLYLTDYHFAADGSNAYGAPGEAARSNAAWISFAPPVLTLPPRGTVPVTVTVRVPRAPDAPGTYWSMLMVESVPPGSAESTLDGPEAAADRVQLAVRERVRYGVQIASHVGAADPAVEVVAAGLVDGPDGAKALSADVANDGERMIDAAVYLDVFDADGASRGRLDGSSARIYPGTSVRHRVDLAALEPGVYEALLVIDGGEAGVFGVQYTLEL